MQKKKILGTKQTNNHTRMLKYQLCHDLSGIKSGYPRLAERGFVTKTICAAFIRRRSHLSALFAVRGLIEKVQWTLTLEFIRGRSILSVRYAVRVSVKSQIWKDIPEYIRERNHLSALYAVRGLIEKVIWTDISEFILGRIQSECSIWDKRFC